MFRRIAGFCRNVRDYWSWENLNPFNWDTSELKLFLGGFFAIMLPIYIFIGLQPAPVDATSLPELQINSINLKTPVTTSELIDRELTVPSYIAGVYTQSENKLFIIGHSSTVFQHLDLVVAGDIIYYDGASYRVTEVETVAKPDIDMGEILRAEPVETIVIMTCAGEPLPNQDATHRLILTAIRES